MTAAIDSLINLTQATHPTACAGITTSDIRNGKINFFSAKWKFGAGTIMAIGNGDAVMGRKFFSS